MSLRKFNNYSKFKTVTSDSKPWRSGFIICICESCGFPQSGVSPDWQKSANEIYRKYETYHQSSDLDQVVFLDGLARHRADLFVSLVFQQFKFPNGSRVLDFGCGGGNLLRSVSSQRKDMYLYGYDLDGRELSNLLKIPNFEELFSGDFSESLNFDLITMSHSLEHLTKPKETLGVLRNLLTENGYLAIAVPDCSVDPFKLLIADHCSHFSTLTLGRLLENAGFEVVHIESSPVTRECWAVCKSCDVEKSSPLMKEDVSWVPASIAWLEDVKNQIEELANSESFGVFGTSNNAVWVFSEFKSQVKFFVDEDKTRIGQDLFGIPVVSPSEVPNGSTVYMPYEPKFAQGIRNKFNSLGVKWVIPFNANLFETQKH